MGPGVPIAAKSNSWVVVLLHGVGFWWTQYRIAQTGIVYMGPGVPIAAKSNSWVVVLLHGVVFWWTHSPDRDTLQWGPGVPIPAKSWVVVLLHGVGFWQDSGRFLAKIARELGFKEMKTKWNNSQK